MMDLLGFTVANEISRSRARSAMPDAPRVPGRPRRRHRGQVRRATARTLHRLADRLEPCGPQAG
ncbi:hypothetical protein [Actinomadura sp. 21ATH]|uniref:hypothetical protein n=1 Tax=Actinomadura sp. 21ATH TaxID=1735444 RepID=UPI0035C12A76